MDILLLCPKTFLFSLTGLLLFCLMAFVSLACFPAEMSESQVTVEGGAAIKTAVEVHEGP